MKEDIGKRIRLAREAKGYKSGELASLCGWEDSKSRISNYESGLSSPSYPDMVKISRILGVSAAYLAFGGENDRKGQSMSLSGDQLVEHETLKSGECELPFCENVSDFGELAEKGQFGHSLDTRVFAQSDLLKSKADQSSAALTYVIGNNMSPYIPDGSLIAVDLQKTDVKDGDLYLLQQVDMLRIAFVYRVPSGYRLKFANEQDWPSEIVENKSGDELKVLGRVFWYAVTR
jgi:transcriptional regulator with XRE-family HTH domain